MTHRVADEAVKWWLPRRDPCCLVLSQVFRGTPTKVRPACIATGDATPTTPGLPHPICTSCSPQANCDSCTCAVSRPAPAPGMFMARPSGQSASCASPCSAGFQMRSASIFSSLGGYQKRYGRHCSGINASVCCTCEIAPCSEHHASASMRPAQIVMRDRVTGEARGFGFVTVESAAADTVERTDHIIGGRKARPPSTHASIAVLRCHAAKGRSVSGIPTHRAGAAAQIDLKRSLPHPKKTRKIFVGGLGADVDDGVLLRLRHAASCSIVSCCRQQWLINAVAPHAARECTQTC